MMLGMLLPMPPATADLPAGAPAEQQEEARYPQNREAAFLLLQFCTIETGALAECSGTHLQPTAGL